MAKDTSLLAHNTAQYGNQDISYWKAHDERHQEESVFNNAEIRLRDLIE